MVGRLYRETLPLCGCGCGKKVNKYTAKYIQGHHRKVDSRKTVQEKTVVQRDIRERATQENMSKLGEGTNCHITRDKLVKAQNLIQYVKLVRLISGKAGKYEHGAQS